MKNIKEERYGDNNPIIQGIKEEVINALHKQKFFDEQSTKFPYDVYQSDMAKYWDIYAKYLDGYIGGSIDDARVIVDSRKSENMAIREASRWLRSHMHLDTSTKGDGINAYESKEYTESNSKFKKGDKVKAQKNILSIHKDKIYTVKGFDKMDDKSPALTFDEVNGKYNETYFSKVTNESKYNESSSQIVEGIVIEKKRVGKTKLGELLYGIKIKEKSGKEIFIFHSTNDRSVINYIKPGKYIIAEGSFNSKGTSFDAFKITVTPGVQESMITPEYPEYMQDFYPESDEPELDDDEIDEACKKSEADKEIEEGKIPSSGTLDRKVIDYYIDLTDKNISVEKSKQLIAKKFKVGIELVNDLLDEYDFQTESKQVTESQADPRSIIKSLSYIDEGAVIDSVNNTGIEFDQHGFIIFDVKTNKNIGVIEYKNLKPYKFNESKEI